VVGGNEEREGEAWLLPVRTSRRWTEERRGDVLADEAPKKGGASSSWSRRSWLCGRRDVEAEEDMARAKEKVGSGEA
jgi:hypothetical protein